MPDSTRTGRRRVDSAQVEGRRIDVKGVVQGVGFRPWVYRIASELGVTGTVRNGPSGVSIEAFARPRVLDAFVSVLGSGGPPSAEITSLVSRSLDSISPADFVIEPSRREGARAASIAPDRATCLECRNEILDPRDRRHGYAFTSCVDCGPRFSIATDAPFDRRATTMAPFTHCDTCAREVDTPAGRRHHSQTNACKLCGPQLVLRDADWNRCLRSDPLTAASEALRRGGIVAVKSVGGYHLACDATDPVVVARLREAKHRDLRPFAVMVADLDAASSLAIVCDRAADLLLSAERPIVLLPARGDGQLAPGVAPDCNRVGVFLPCSPLHELLVRAAQRPLVMTSANLSDEPTVFRDADARRDLAGIADLFLTHDRAIVTRVDDSVAAVIGERPVMIRRSRGYVPRALGLARRVPEPILACGGHLKNTFCIARDNAAFLGPHVGDLQSLATYRDYGEAIERMQTFVDARPDVLVHDLHPDYLSTHYANERAARRRIGVQHHHAHVAAVMAEHGLDGPVLGFAYDGTGYGTDGSSWGGELLLADLAGYHRIATLRPVALPGGEQAIKETWRIALALLEDAFDGKPPLDRLSSFDSVEEDRLVLVRKILGEGVNSPPAHGLGRYFDGIGAIALGRATAGYEGHVAMALEQACDLPARACDRAAGGGYDYEIDTGSDCWQVDLRATVRGVVGDKLAGRAPGLIAARFHDTVVRFSTELARMALDRYGRVPVVLGGGCFQNARLAEGLLAALAGGPDVYRAERVPSNDGGLALGQVAVGAAVLAGRASSCA